MRPPGMVALESANRSAIRRARERQDRAGDGNQPAGRGSSGGPRLGLDLSDLHDHADLQAHEGGRPWLDRCRPGQPSR